MFEGRLRGALVFSASCVGAPNGRKYAVAARARYAVNINIGHRQCCKHFTRNSPADRQDRARHHHDRFRRILRHAVVHEFAHGDLRRQRRRHEISQQEVPRTLGCVPLAQMQRMYGQQIDMTVVRHAGAQAPGARPDDQRAIDSRRRQEARRHRAARRGRKARSRAIPRSRSTASSIRSSIASCSRSSAARRRNSTTSCAANSVAPDRRPACRQRVRHRRRGRATTCACATRRAISASSSSRSRPPRT